MLSVIVPVYNTDKYLNDCIESVLRQTYYDMEILLINDGSTDNSLQKCKEFAKTDKRIIVLDKSNGGLSSARNMGLDHATGDYIAFIDSDDTVSSDVYEKNIDILKNDKTIDILQFPVYKNYGKENAFINSQKTGEIVGTENLFREWIENNRIEWIACGKIYKRKIFDQLRFPEGMIYEDNFLMSDILNSIRKLYISNHGLYYYYDRENTITTSPHTLKKELDTQKVSLKILSNLIRFKSLQKGKIKLLSRIFNVYLSLSKNYKVNSIDDLFIREIKRLTIQAVLNSELSNKEKIKLALLKIIGYKFYFKFYS